MDRISALLAGTPLPRMARIQQVFPATRLEDPLAALRASMRQCPAATTITPGMRVAVTVGSRGMALLPELVRELIAGLRELGADPFIVPAMGSHGGATADGQRALLAALGVTEESSGCAIQATMDVVEIGRLENGMPVMMDALAHAADGIVVFNRIKPHNSFRYHIESGLAKMLAIGLGNQSGADHCHAWGFAHMGELVEAMARMKLERCRVLMGVGTIENAYDQVARVVALSPQELLAREIEELEFAKANMPKLLLDPLDVLVVDRTGKEYSGGGLDANIVGTSAAGIVMSPAKITRTALLDVSDHSLGNAIGVGLVDVTTTRLLEKADRVAMYANALTSKVPAAARMPMALPSDRLAIQAAVKTSTPKDLGAVRVMRIPNTLHLYEAYISEALMPEAAGQPGIRILGDAEPMTFDAQGTLTDPWGFAPLPQEV